MNPCLPCSLTSYILRGCEALHCRWHDTLCDFFSLDLRCSSALAEVGRVQPAAVHCWGARVCSIPIGLQNIPLQKGAGWTSHPGQPKVPQNGHQWVWAGLGLRIHTHLYIILNIRIWDYKGKVVDSVEIFFLSKAFVECLSGTRRLKNAFYPCCLVANNSDKLK